jgi:hypothetical protein
LAEILALSDCVSAFYAVSDTPGARSAGLSWTGANGSLWLMGGEDSSGNLWLFGGCGYAPNGSTPSFSDLWRFTP